MRSLAPAVPLLILLSVLCLTAACTIPFFGEAQEEMSGPSSIRGFHPPVEKTYQSMSSSVTRLREYLPGEKLDKNDRIPVYFIQGTDLDAQGNAARWTFAVNLTTGPTMIILENDMATKIPWGAPFPYRVIMIEAVIPPEDLFKKNHDLIFPSSDITSFEQSELDLHEGIYTVTLISNGTMNYLMFDAETGEPVE